MKRSLKKQAQNIQLACTWVRTHEDIKLTTGGYLWKHNILNDIVVDKASVKFNINRELLINILSQ